MAVAYGGSFSMEGNAVGISHSATTSASNNFLVLALWLNDWNGLSSVYYGGQPMTLIGQSGGWWKIFGIKTNLVGTYSVTCSWTTLCRYCSIITVYNGVLGNGIPVDGISSNAGGPVTSISTTYTTARSNGLGVAFGFNNSGYGGETISGHSLSAYVPGSGGFNAAFFGGYSDTIVAPGNRTVTLGTTPTSTTHDLVAFNIPENDIATNNSGFFSLL